MKKCLVVSALVFFAVLAVYSKTKGPTAYNRGDNYWYVPTSQSLLSHGTFDLSADYLPHVLQTHERGNWMVVPLNGRWFNYFPFGTSIVAAPLVMVGNLMYRDTPAGIERDFRIADFAARVIAALSVSLLLILAWILTRSVPLAAGLGLAFGLATTQLSIHAGGLWSHNAALLLETVALIIVACEGGRYAGWSAVPLALAYACRPTAASLAGVVLCYLLWRDRKSAVLFGIVTIACLVAASCLWHWAYGTFSPPYFGGDNITFALGRHGFRFLEAVPGLLVSPNRGLLVFMPIFLFSFAGLFYAVSSLRKNHFFVMIGAWFLAHWLMASLYPHWWLGHSFGPRAFSELTAGLTCLLIPFVERFRGFSASRRWVLAPLIVACIAWSAYANWRGSFSLGPAEWNATPASVDTNPERVWDWSDLQILRK